MDERAFLGRLQRLLDGPGEIPREARIIAARRYLDGLTPADRDETAADLQIVSYQASRRPIDEGLHPGYGASEALGLLGGGGRRSWILYRLSGLHGLAPERVTVAMSAWFVAREPGAADQPIAGLQDIAVPLARVAAAAYPAPAIEPANLADAEAHAFVAFVEPEALTGADADPFSSRTSAAPTAAPTPAATLAVAFAGERAAA